MVGREVGEIFPKVPHEPGETVLVLSGVRAGAPVPTARPT